MTARERRRIEAVLQDLRARYDNGAVSPGVYALIKKLESELAWANHDETREP